MRILNKMAGILLALTGPLLAYELHANHADEVIRMAGGSSGPSALGTIACVYAIGTMGLGIYLAITTDYR